MNTFLLILSTIIAAFGQILLRVGMRGLAPADDKSLTFITAVLFNPYVAGGIGLYFLALVPWLIALRAVPVGYAYPFISIGFVIVLIASALWLHEPITAWQLVGIFLIILGIFSISIS